MRDIDLKTIIVGLHMWLDSASFSHRRMGSRSGRFISAGGKTFHTQTRELPHHK